METQFWIEDIAGGAGADKGEDSRSDSVLVSWPIEDDEGHWFSADCVLTVTSVVLSSKSLCKIATFHYTQHSTTSSYLLVM